VALRQQQALERGTRAFIEVGRKMPRGRTADPSSKPYRKLPAEACGGSLAAWRLRRRSQKNVACMTVYERDAKGVVYHLLDGQFHRDEVPILLRTRRRGRHRHVAHERPQCVISFAKYLRPLRITDISSTTSGGSGNWHVSVETPGGERGRWNGRVL